LQDAFTDVKRLRRWYSPVTGDLKQGRNYQIEGNAKGTIIVCNPPTLLCLTWEYGANMSWLDVRLQAEAPARPRLILAILRLWMIT
jgi:hypothetical protein